MEKCEWTLEKVKACYDIINELEEKYLGKETRHIPYDKYFRMLAHGMTESEAKKYTKAKMTLITVYHEL